LQHAFSVSLHCKHAFQHQWLRLPELNAVCATLQNSRKKYNSDSQKPAPWTWFKSNPNNPYKVQRCFEVAGLLTKLARHQWLAPIAADTSITAVCCLQSLHCGHWQLLRVRTKRKGKKLLPTSGACMSSSKMFSNNSVLT